MKTQLRKPARIKASYTDQYKQEALELWRSSGRSAAKASAWQGGRRIFLIADLLFPSHEMVCNEIWS